MILIGLGANLPAADGSPPRATLLAAIDALARAGVAVERLSSWYSSAPHPPSDQPRYVNAVAAVTTALGPQRLLALLHGIEQRFGRVRSEPNAARAIDLDLLAYGDLVRPGPEPPLLPHPRLAERGFVLLPLADIAPGWRHPVSGETVEDLIARLPPEEDVRRT